MQHLSIQGSDLFFLCVSYVCGLFDSLSELIHSLAGGQENYENLWNDVLEVFDF
jgi:hypothetical protein